MSETRNSSLLGKITVFFVICCCCLPAQAKYGGGTGEPNDPYLIYTANQMNEIGADSNDWDKCFKLMADIDLSAFTGTSFNIIGYFVNWDDNKPFTAVFDGSGHTISNFTYNSTGKWHIGLFGYVSGENAEIKNLGLIDPNVEAGTGEEVGSLVGWLDNGTITNCYVEGGSVSGYSRVGGLVGWNRVGTIIGCYSKDSVTGDERVGGLVGQNSYGTITNCYAAASVSGDWTVGGLVGENFGIITNCYSSGSVSGTKYVGGLVGGNWFDSTISNCYSTGSVVGDRGGGLVGYNEGTVLASFWDIETSGQTTSAGGTSKTTAEMHQQSTFQDWDFINTWAIGENQTYPYLRVYLAGDINKDGIVNFKDLGFLALHWLENYGAENKPPQVWITYPEDGARLMVGGVPPQTMIMAEANDYDGIVVRVEFFANDLKLDEDTDGSDGWNYLWKGYSLGWHVLTATAWDNEGLSGTSSPVNVEVWMPYPPPP